MANKGVSVETVLHALGDSKRRRIVEMLSQQPHSVSYLAEQLEISLTAVGQHLQILEAAGLARTEKIGRVRTASLETQGLNALQVWIRERRSQWELRLDRLGRLLANPEADV